MKALFDNYITGLPGIIGLAIVLWEAWQNKTVNVDTLKDALIAAGLVGAKDFNVTGGTRT